MIRRLWFSLVMLLPCGALAQSIEGIVTRAGAPVEGAVVLLRDNTGGEAGRSASRDDGRYALRAAPGRYTLEVLQIGWRPTIIGPIEARAPGPTIVDVSLASARVSLAPVSVVGRAQCAIRPDSSASAFLVWEAARAALLATSVTGTEALIVRATHGDRVLAENGREVVSDTTEVVTGPTVNPFKSLAATVFADSGYVTRDANRDLTFWAPDADALLSDQFLDTHCLTLVSVPDTSRIAVRFSPTTRRNGIVDIDGTLSLDRASSELRSLEFRYVNGSDVVTRTNAGGEVEFLRVPRGRWVVSHWAIRYPLVGARWLHTGSVIPGQRPETRRHDELVGLKTTSGNLLSIARRGVTLWERGRVSLLVHVIDSVSGAARRGVLVGFAGSGSLVATDTLGQARIDLADPGSQVLSVADPALQSLGLPKILKVIDVPLVNDVVVDVPIPPARSIVVSRCGARSVDWGEGMLTGRLSSAAADSTTIVLVTSTPFTRLGTGSQVVVEKYFEIKPAADQSFSVCGIARDATLRVRKSTDAPGSGITAKFSDGALGLAVVVP